MRRFVGTGATVLMAVVFACGGSDDDTNKGGSSGTSGNGGGDGGTGAPTDTDGGATQPPAASCASAGGTATMQTPTLLRKLVDQKSAEGWLASPAVADIDLDGKPETIVVRESRVVVWHADGTFAWAFDTKQDRVWASPIVGNFTGDDKLEIAVAARQSAWILDASGNIISGFPQTFGGSNEIRSVAAGDLDGDGALDLAVGVKNGTGDPFDIVNAWHANGTPVAGFPPVASGVSGCTSSKGASPCYFAGLYDQNIAIGTIDTADGAKQGLVLPHDDSYASFFHGTGVATDANPIYTKAKKTPAVRYLYVLSDAEQGYADDEETATQAHFTNTPPAIADIDKDGTPDIVMVGSAQNAAQDDRLRGVGLWVMDSHATRHAGWDPPFQVPTYVMGLNDGFAHDFDGDAVSGADNLVGLTNQATVADINATKAGLEIIFAGFDGKIHAVAADKTDLWSFSYGEDGRSLTPGIVVADLSADGVPEIVFATYSPDQGGGNLYILDSTGKQLQKIGLPERGSMAVPTIADADGDGTLEIVVSLKDEIDSKETVLLYNVPGSKPNCLLWPTGRANYLRNGWVR